jgi:hypothetical protein
MKTLNSHSNSVKPYKRNVFSATAFMSVSDKFSKINNYLQSGKEIPNEITTNFVTCTLSNNPYAEIE